MFGSSLPNPARNDPCAQRAPLPAEELVVSVLDLNEEVRVASAVGVVEHGQAAVTCADGSRLHGGRCRQAHWLGERSYVG